MFIKYYDKTVFFMRFENLNNTINILSHNYMVSELQVREYFQISF